VGLSETKWNDLIQAWFENRAGLKTGLLNEALPG
jgi:hypothetical protein